MAQGLVTFTSDSIGRRVDETKAAYLNMRRLLDRLIAIRNGNDYAAVAAATGASDGQTLFDNIDAAIAGLTTAYNALSNMDSHANI
jgi:hypothetical protein